jgi:pimeloyl-ACP methyl ester carboxylesterase
MSQTIYCISGLGADEQVFSKLQITGYQLVCLQWLPPSPGEPFANYAQRMHESIPEENPILLGLSFGGMLSIEIAKLFPVKKLILISSVKTKQEQPWWMHAAGKLKLHQLVRPQPHPLFYPIENYFLGVKEKQEVELAIHFRKTVNKDYLQWAIHNIVTWNNVTIPENILHIHGTADKLFPFRCVKANYQIKGGGHFMVYNRADEIGRILLNELQAVK